MPENTGFYRLFFLRELPLLMGKRGSNFFFLALMLFITFTVIGFAEGSLTYLGIKIQDPYINLVNLHTEGRSRERVNRIMQDLGNQEIMSDFQILHVSGYRNLQYNYYDYGAIQHYYESGELDTNKVHPIWGRTIEYDDPVMSEIFMRNNRKYGEAFRRQDDIGLILTHETLLRLNYPLNSPFIWMDYPAMHEGKQFREAIPIPIRGVVESLPGRARKASTIYFHQVRSEPIHGRPALNPFQDNRLFIAFSGPDHEVRSFREALQSSLNKQHTKREPTSYEVMATQKSMDGNFQVIAIDRTEGKALSKQSMDSLFHEIIHNDNMKEFRENTYRFFQYPDRLPEISQIRDFSRIAVNFSSLDRLTDFGRLIRDRHDLEVDLAERESRQNFLYVSRLTRIVSVTLIAFSVISIMLFVVHLLHKHLDTIKRNLGTYKAFGLDDRLISRIYVLLAISVVFASTLLAFVASAMFGYSGGLVALLSLLGSAFEAGDYFSLKSVYFYITVSLLGISSVVLLHYTSTRILGNSPGDLIYERK